MWSRSDVFFLFLFSFSRIFTFSQFHKIICLFNVFFWKEGDQKIIRIWSHISNTSQHEAVATEPRYPEIEAQLCCILLETAAFGDPENFTQNNTKIPCRSWSFLKIFFRFTPWKISLTWNLQITHLERKMIFQTSMIMFHVNLQACTLPETNIAYEHRPGLKSGVVSPSTIFSGACMECMNLLWLNQCCFFVGLRFSWG